MTTDDAQITNSTSVMLTTVAGDDYAIGYVSLGSLNDTVKALKIDGEEATEQNIKDGKYKICRPFNIATQKGADNELAKDFISYIMSKEGQQVISDNGYIGDDFGTMLESKKEQLYICQKAIDVIGSVSRYMQERCPAPVSGDDRARYVEAMSSSVEDTLRRKLTDYELL